MTGKGISNGIDQKEPGTDKTPIYWPHWKPIILARYRQTMVPDFLFFKGETSLLVLGVGNSVGNKFFRQIKECLEKLPTN